MVRRPSFLLPFLLLLASSVESAAQSGEAYPRFSDFAHLEDHLLGEPDLIGISPSGAKLLRCLPGDGSSVVFETVSRGTAGLRTVRRFPLEGRPVPQGYMKALWSRDERYAVVSFSSRYPRQLLYMKSWPLVVVDTKDGRILPLWDESWGASVLKGGVLVYGPSFTAGDDGIVYHVYGGEGTRVMRQRFDGSPATEVLSFERGSYVLAMELSPTAYLTYQEPAAADKGCRIVLQDAARRAAVPVIDLPRREGGQMLEIRGLSRDRRAVLVERWTGIGSMPSTEHVAETAVIRFSEDFRSFTKEVVPVDPGFQAWNAALSPDGRLVALAGSDLPARGPAGPEDRRVVVFRSGSGGTSTVFSNRDLAAAGRPAWTSLGYEASPLRSGFDGLCLTADGMLTVGLDDTEAWLRLDLGPAAASGSVWK